MDGCEDCNGEEGLAFPWVVVVAGKGSQEGHRTSASEGSLEEAYGAGEGGMGNLSEAYLDHPGAWGGKSE